MVNPHFSRWSHCFQSPVAWIAPPRGVACDEDMCNVSSVGRHAKEAYAATIEAYPSLKDRAWCGSKTWNKVKQEFFCYWHPSFNVPFHLWDVKAMVGVFELIHSIPKRFWASNKVGFFGSSYGYACSLVLWLILSLETTPPLNKQVQH